MGATQNYKRSWNKSFCSSSLLSLFWSLSYQCKPDVICCHTCLYLFTWTLQWRRQCHKLESKEGSPIHSVCRAISLPHAHTLGMKKYMGNAAVTTFTPACVAVSAWGECASLSQLMLLYQAKENQINSLLTLQKGVFEDLLHRSV